MNRALRRLWTFWRCLGEVFRHKRFAWLCSLRQCGLQAPGLFASGVDIGATGREGTAFLFSLTFGPDKEKQRAPFRQQKMRRFFFPTLDAILQRHFDYARKRLSCHTETLIAIIALIAI